MSVLLWIWMWSHPYKLCGQSYRCRKRVITGIQKAGNTVIRFVTDKADSSDFADSLKIFAAFKELNRKSDIVRKYDKTQRSG